MPLHWAPRPVEVPNKQTTDDICGDNMKFTLDAVP